jgi:YHS domain-containing protein
MVPLIKYAKVILSIQLVISLVAFSGASVFAVDEPSQKIHGVAIKGYDPVAYFTENRAVKGHSDYSYNWNEASWHFSNPENRDLFAANPEKYAPKHGGF